MAQPSNWQNGTIAGAFLADDFTPFAGAAVITAAVPAIRAYGVAVATLGTRTVPLVNGAFSVNVPASTDPDISPKDWTYTVTIVGPGPGFAKSKYPTFTFRLAPGETVDLTQVAIVAPSPGLPNIVGGGGGGGGPVTAALITDATTTGRNVLTAADATAARGAIGAGTSNVAIGTTAGTAKDAAAGTAWASIPDKPAVFPPSSHTTQPAEIVGSTSFGQSMLVAATPAAGRTALGATSVGNSLITAADAAAGASAVGLGTANADIAALNTSMAATTNASNLTSGTVNPLRSAVATVFRVRKVAGVWPARPTSRTDVTVEWIGPNPSPPIVTSGTGGMYELDSRGITAT